MRSPLSFGAGRRSALSLTLLLVIAAGLAAAPVLGAHHLESEGNQAPKPARILVIAADDFTGLVGASRTFWASICDADGTDCKDANKAKWTVKPRKGLTLSRKKGVQVLAEMRKAGTYELTAKQGGATDAATVTINEPLERTEPEAAGADELRLYVSPGEAEMRIGETIFLTAWGCPLSPDGRLGQDNIPDGFDDDCIKVDISEINLDQNSPVALLGPDGPFFSITLEAFPADVDGDLSFIGAQVVTDAGTSLASIIARNEAITASPATERRYGDADGDGEADSDVAIWSTFFGGRYEPAYDTDENGVLDQDDWQALTGLEMGMPTPPPARE